MTMKNTVADNSALYKVWNFEVLLNGPVQGAISLTYSMVNRAEYDSCSGCFYRRFPSDERFTGDRRGGGWIGLGGQIIRIASYNNLINEISEGSAF